MTVQKGKLVEIPLDADIKVNPFKKLFNNKAVNFIKGLAPAAREIFRNNTFRDKEGRLKRSIAIRRDTNKMLEQYNNDSQMKEFTFEKDGESYTVSTVGTKMMDGRPLSGFRVSKQNGELDKNVYMEAFDITTIPEEDLGEFIGGHMDTQGVQSEYIGKPVMRDGKVEHEIDQGFMQNFNYKQQRAVKDNPTYAAYMERESKKKVSQIKKLQGMFKRVSSRARQEVLEVIEQARVGRFAQKTKYATRGKMNESSEIDLGGRV